MRLQQRRFQVARQRAGQDGLGERRPSRSDGPKGRQRRLAVGASGQSPDAANDVIGDGGRAGDRHDHRSQIRPRRAADAEAPLDVPRAQRRHADGQQGEEDADRQAVTCR